MNDSRFLFALAESDSVYPPEIGNPQKAAEKAVDNLANFEAYMDEVLGEIEKLAGPFMAPGIKFSFLNEIEEMARVRKHK